MTKTIATISYRAIKAVARIICGDVPLNMKASISPYRTSSALDEFFLEELGLTPTPEIVGGSRASCTEAWLKRANGTPELTKILNATIRDVDYQDTDFEPSTVAKHLNALLAHDGVELVRAPRGYVLATTAGVAVPTTDDKPHDILTDAYVREQVAKCDHKLATGDLDGAVTNSRTLIEAVLFELQRRLGGAREDYKGDLPRLFKEVSKKMNLDAERTDLDERFREVIRGLIQVVNGLAPLRNKLSDGHARVRAPEPHHARVIVNAAKTVTIFLVDSFNYQVGRNKLKDAATPKEQDPWA